MNVEDVQRRVKEIQQQAGDPKVAHSLEDSLHQDVLQEIAEKGIGVQAPALAAKALKTVDIDFPRWCA